MAISHYYYFSKLIFNFIEISNLLQNTCNQQLPRNKLYKN